MSNGKACPTATTARAYEPGIALTAFSFVVCDPHLQQMVYTHACQRFQEAQAAHTGYNPVEEVASPHAPHSTPVPSVSVNGHRCRQQLITELGSPVSNRSAVSLLYTSGGCGVTVVPL
jgi:hypothetical protein